MDKESLNYMTKKVDEGKVLSKRMVKGDLPEGMTMEDAMQEYQGNKTVITGNDGKFSVEGTECIDCHGTHSKEEMRYCQCDEGLVCPTCCSHCTYNENDTCIWPID